MAEKWNNVAIAIVKHHFPSSLVRVQINFQKQKV